MAEEFKTGSVGEDVIKNRLVVATDIIREMIGRGVVEEAPYLTVYLERLETAITEAYIGPVEIDCPGGREMISDNKDPCAPDEVFEFQREDVKVLESIYFIIAAFEHAARAAGTISRTIEHGVSEDINECLQYGGSRDALIDWGTRHPRFPNRVLYERVAGKAFGYLTSYRFACFVAIPGRGDIQRFELFASQYGREALKMTP